MRRRRRGPGNPTTAQPVAGPFLAGRRGLAWISALGLVAALAAGLVVASQPRRPATAQESRR